MLVGLGEDQNFDAAPPRCDGLLLYASDGQHPSRQCDLPCTRIPCSGNLLCIGLSSEPAHGTLGMLPQQSAQFVASIDPKPLQAPVHLELPLLTLHLIAQRMQTQIDCSAHAARQSISEHCIHGSGASAQADACLSSPGLAARGGPGLARAAR